MSKGMTEGRADGRLAMDDLDPMAFIGTSSTHSIATRTRPTPCRPTRPATEIRVERAGRLCRPHGAERDDPKVETVAEALRRTTGNPSASWATAEVEDATPAAVVSHTRERGDKADIVGMMYASSPMSFWAAARPIS